MQMSGPTRTEPVLADEAATKLAAGLARLGMAMRHHAWAERGRDGLTPTQSQILALLAVRVGQGRTMTQLARDMAVTPPTVSDAVAALERKQLVTRTRSEVDGRRVEVRLSRRGARRAAASTLWPEALLRAIDAMDETERVTLTRAVVKMIHALQEAGHIPVARLCVTCRFFRPNVHPGERRPHHCAYVDAPLGDGDLRLDCPEHDVAAPPERERLWMLFIEGRPVVGASPAPGALPSPDFRSHAS